MLYGEPGTGKTSGIQSIAGYFNLNITIVNLSTIQDDNQLITMFSQIPKRSVLLLEDIDLIFSKLSKGKKESNSNDKNNITFAGLLNALDGACSSEGLITFLTTNHIEKLPDSSIRSGRIDKKVNISLANKDTIQKMLLFNNIDDNNFLNKFTYPISPADIQQEIIIHQNP